MHAIASLSSEGLIETPLAVGSFPINHVHCPHKHYTGEMFMHLLPTMHPHITNPTAVAAAWTRSSTTLATKAYCSQLLKLVMVQTGDCC